MRKKLEEIYPQTQKNFYTDTKKQSERDSILRKITETIISSINDNAILDNISKELSEIFNVQRVVVTGFTMDNNGRKQVSKYNEVDLITDERVKISEFVREIIIEKGDNLIIDDILECCAPEYFKEIINKLGVKSILAVPIKDKDTVWGGIFLIEYNKFRHWTEEEISLLESISDQVSISIKQDDLYGSQKHLAQREILLREVISEMRSTLDVNKIMNTFITQIGKIFNSDLSNFCLIDPTTSKFMPVNEYSFYVSSPDVKCPLGVNLEDYPWGDFFKTVCKEIAYSNVMDFMRDFNLFGTKSEEFIKCYEIKSFIIMPVVYMEHHFGLLEISYTKGYKKITDEDINLAKILADQAAITLHQIMLCSKEKQTVEREKLLRKITETIRSSLDMKVVNQNIVNELGKAFKADRCYLRVIDQYESSGSIDIEYTSSPDVLSVKEGFFNSEIGNYMWSILSQNKPIIANFKGDNYGNIEENKPIIKFFKSLDVKANYGIPIVIEGELFGAFVLQYTKKNIYLSKEDLDLLKIIAHQSGMAIKQADLYSTIKKQAERELLLLRINETISKTLDLDSILNLACKEMLDLFKVDRVAYSSITHYNDLINVVEVKLDTITTTYQVVNIPAKVNEYLYERLLKNDEVLVINNMEYDSVPDFYRDYHNKLGTKSIISVAIKKDNEMLGVMGIFQNSHYRQWNKEEIDLMKAIAEQIFIAIRQTKLHSKSQEAVKIKSDFITNISHEIRTPLNAIIGFSQLLENPDYTKETQQKYLNNISTSANHLLELINSILDFSKIEAGNMDLVYEKFDSARIIKEISSSIKSIAIQKNITIKTELCESVLEADILKFKQIVLNLLSNAVKFTNNNGQITIRTKSINNELVVEVEDTGIGIAEEDRDKIFKYFRQVDSSYSRNQEGTGLGLALAKKIVELHNGKIDFESKMGEGSKFWFVLPLSKK